MSKVRGLLAAVGLAVACGGEPQPLPEAVTNGVWWGPVAVGGVYDESAIEMSAFGGGTIHFLSDGKKMSEIALEKVRYRPPTLSFRAGAYTVEARIDGEASTMAGEATAGRSHRVTFTAERRDPASVPGLLARSPETKASYRPPLALGDGWAVATAEDAGLERKHIEALTGELIDDAGGVMNALLVVYEDRLVVEEYFHGWGHDDLHLIASCTKSVTSLVVGAAIDRGLIEDLDQRVLDLLPAYSEAAAAGWENVLLRHLLSMTSGVGWPPDHMGLGVGGGAGFGTGPGAFRRLLARELSTEPGSSWQYSNPEVNLLGAVLHRATGVHADVFAARHLFAPLGITEFDWSTYGKRSGYPNLAGSMQLRPRDMARLGALVLGKGQWQGQRVLSPAWIDESTTPQADTGTEERDGYGFLWWLMDSPSGNVIIAARGLGSQFILVDPARRLVVVTTGGNDINGRTFDVLEVLSRHLYPNEARPSRAPGLGL